MTFTRRWLILFALGAVPLLFAGIAPFFLTLTYVWYGLLFVLALADRFLLPPAQAFGVERLAPERMALETTNEIRLRVKNNGTLPASLELRETPPDGIGNDLPETPFQFTVPAGGRHAAVYHLMPAERGDFAFGEVYLRICGRLGLVQRVYRYELPQPIRVYPNLSEIAKFAILAKKNRLQQAGIRAARLQGAGREFESLRDYLPDDELRRIDWKASARRGKLVSRQYEVERAQTILLMIDAGRTMLAEIDGVQKIEYAINAALLLAYVATQTDDKVGLLVFSDRVHTYLPPRKGRGQVFAIMEALYNVKATLAEPDYTGAMAYLRARWRRRSLVVAFTDVWDADSSRLTISELASLQPLHLVAAVMLLDTKLLRTSAQSVVTSASAYEKTVAMQVLDDRRKALATLSQRGVLVVDSPAEKLSADLVNRYLEVKERQML
jgi:uncharacterized protein (DUF58 family)